MKSANFLKEHKNVTWVNYPGISDDLVRVTIGCEDYEDLRDNLDQALNQIG